MNRMSKKTEKQMVRMLKKLKRLYKQTFIPPNYRESCKLYDLFKIIYDSHAYNYNWYPYHADTMKEHHIKQCGVHVTKDIDCVKFALTYNDNKYTFTIKPNKPFFLNYDIDFNSEDTKNNVDRNLFEMLNITLMIYILTYLRSNDPKYFGVTLNEKTI